MPKKTSPRAPAREGDARAYYAPHVLQQVQSLLSGLADLDCAFESDLATVQASDVPEVIKQEVLRTLEERHRERRTLIVGQLEALHSRAMFRD
jgi:hypothetical protein